ncbi:MAG TPA: hypothetical protein VD651_01340 [Nitrosarchaeum sp.]|nr:hypothetical protein [Nitrosarchaeum sp.]
MNSKIFVFVAVIALAAALGMILLSGSSSVINSPENTNQEIKSDVSQEPISSQIQSLNVELDDISIKEVTPRGATIEISFKINNPNSNSVIVQVMDYQLFETGYSNVEQISGGQIGSRPEGMVEFGSDYYVLLAENSIVLKDKIQLKNTGNTPKLWSDLESDTAKWRVTGTVFYNLSSMTSGQENTLHFEFEK